MGAITTIMKLPQGKKSQITGSKTHPSKIPQEFMLSESHLDSRYQITSNETSWQEPFQTRPYRPTSWGQPSPIGKKQTKVTEMQGSGFIFIIY